MPRPVANTDSALVAWLKRPVSKVEQSIYSIDESFIGLDGVRGDRFGKRTLLLGSSGIEQGADTWGMKQVRRTPRYTADWQEVPVARA